MTTPKLKVQLYPGWREVQIPNAPTTYVRGAASHSGALQVSLAQFGGGKLPDASEQLLVAICEKMASNVHGTKKKSSGSGNCEFGMFGTVVARGESPNYFQVWVLSNGREFILVTHTCDKEPDPAEVIEANEIAMRTGCT